MRLDLDALRERALPMRDGFYHVVGYYRAFRREDFDALVAEVERLREEVERLQQDAVIARSVETSLTVEVEQLRMERAAVVTYLLAPGTSCDNYALAEAIERGDHIPEGTP